MPPDMRNAEALDSLGTTVIHSLPSAAVVPNRTACDAIRVSALAVFAPDNTGRRLWNIAVGCPTCSSQGVQVVHMHRADEPHGNVRRGPCGTSYAIDVPAGWWAA